MEPGERVREIKLAGFSAVCISTENHPDDGVALTGKLQRHAASKPIISPDGRAVFIKI